MNLASLLFTFLSYGLIVAMYNVGTTEDAPEFPTFEAPNVDFINTPDECGGFFDCTEYVGKVLTNIVLGVVYVVLLIVEIVRLIVEVLILIAQSAFTGIDGTPEWLNAVLLGFLGVTAIVIIIKTLRKGDTDTA